MTRESAVLIVCIALSCILLSGCPRGDERAGDTTNTPPVGPSNAPAPQKEDTAGEKPAASTGEKPSTRAEFETWVRETSPNAPKTEDEEQAVAALDQWLRDECEMEDLVLLPAPAWESKQMPDGYYEWYKEDELGVYLWDERDMPHLRLVVGPPEACAWCVAHMGKDDGKWVLTKATSSPDEPVDNVIYERGKGFIEQKEASGD